MGELKVDAKAHPLLHAQQPPLCWDISHDLQLAISISKKPGVIIADWLPINSDHHIINLNMLAKLARPKDFRVMYPPVPQALLNLTV